MIAIKIQNYSSIQDKTTADKILSAVATIRYTNELPPLTNEDHAEYIFLKIEQLDYPEVCQKYQLGNTQIRNSKMNLNSVINLVTPTFFQTINGAVIQLEKYDSLKQLQQALPNLQNNMNLTHQKWNRYINSPNHEIYLDTKLGRQDAMEEMRGKHANIK